MAKKMQNKKIIYAKRKKHQRKKLQEKIKKRLFVDARFVLYIVRQKNVLKKRKLAVQN